MSRNSRTRTRLPESPRNRGAGPLGNTIEAIHAKYDFRWEVLEGIVGGKSIFDSETAMTGLPLESVEDADRFLRSYGFDLEDPIEKAEVIGNLQEAINFVRKYFLQPDNPDGLRLEIPRKIAEAADFRDLLLMASLSYPGQMKNKAGRELQGWACALLKIVHTIAHIDKDVRVTYFGDIQKQIFDRFYRVIHRDREQLYLGERADDPLRVDLVAFETKPKKARESLLLKMLHKQESVADDIFDQVGLRFVAKNKTDCLRVIKYLKDATIIMPANIKPSRSFNTLIDLEDFRPKLEELLTSVHKGELGEEEFRRELDKSIRSPEKFRANPHSSEHYRSIHFTARQLIKLKNPLYEGIKKLKSEVKKSSPDGSITKIVDGIDLKYLKREIRFFYPYEVQVMDEVSKAENEKGRSAHSEYKKAQITTAMKRVFGSLVDGAK